MAHILIFKIKSVCYDSTFYLADLYGRTLEGMGHQVEYFNIDDETFSALEKYEGRHFDAMLDFNSLLPNVDTEEGELFLNMIDAPFYNYILDHPLYHNKQLKAGLKRYHVICLDDDHAVYIKKYYPHIQSVTVLPLCGLPFLADSRSYQVSKLFDNASMAKIPESAKTPWEIPKTADIIFTGTYTNPNDLFDKIRSFDKPFSDEMVKMVSILLSNTGLTQEEALFLLTDELGYDRDKLNVADRLYTFFLVDMYVKAHIREQILDTILKAGLKVTVYGGMWDIWATRYKAQLDIHELVPFKDSPKVLAGGWLSLNIMPWFKAGIHDRVLTSMRSGTVSFTDTSKMLDSTFADGKELLTYDLGKVDEIPEKLEVYLSDKVRLMEIAEAGRQAVEKEHTELERCKVLSRLFEGEAGA